MYAIFVSGGKQYLVKKGEIVRLEKVNYKIGDCINFNEVLLVVDGENIKTGNPILKKITIKGEVILHDRKKKIKIIKFKRRKHSQKKQGHRQWFSDIKIIDIINN
ncbi:MAG: 50S ribosomal protein L21 [Arsenophonus sp.]|nr:MAG: 50S ribosomal protein L21 [Arsenophonus sp.]